MTLRDELIAEVLENDQHPRNGGPPWRRVECDVKATFTKEHIATFPVLILDDARYAVAIDVVNRVRYVDHRIWPVTIGEQARCYIDWARGRRADGYMRKVHFTQEAPNCGALQFLHTPPAMHFSPPESRDGDWYALDITSAYWSLLRANTLDMWFRPRLDHTMSVLWGVMDWLRADEVSSDLGHAIYGNLRRVGVTEYRYGRRIETTYHSVRFAPDAVGLILWQMHAIANEAVRLFECCHVAVDSFVVPEWQGEHLRDWLWDQWGLGTHLQARGEGHLYAYTHWRIGTEWRNRSRRRRDLSGSSTLLDLTPLDCASLLAIRQHGLKRTSGDRTPQRV